MAPTPRGPRNRTLRLRPLPRRAHPHHPRGRRQRLRTLPEGDFTLGAFSDTAPDTPETLLGFVAFERVPGIKECHKAHFYGVYLTPTARGCGLARNLLQAAIDRARQLPGLDLIHLSASPTQAAAHRLYRSLGFEIYGHEPQALKLGNTYIAEDHMLLSLR